MKTLDSVAPAPNFASLPEPRGLWSSLGVSFVVQAGLLVGIINTTISFVAPVLHPVDTHDSVQLVAPASTPPQEVPSRKVPPARMPKPEARAPKVTLPPIELPKPQKIEVAKVTPPPLPVPVARTETLRSPVLAAGAKIPRSVISTNFGGSSAPVTENKPVRQVQTGGFGDPNGVPMDANSTGKGITVAKLGSFDLPEGGGSGNGTGGSKGVHGTVASAGFGNGIATQGEGGTGGPKKVSAANFDAVTAPSDTPKHQSSAAVQKDTPVALLSKPSPSYTSEARQRKIEGDVELDVEFSATGKVHVLRVLQGLGYGLDEAAVKAAENIRFVPARRDGQAVDAHGRLRIVFRLS